MDRNLRIAALFLLIVVGLIGVMSSQTATERYSMSELVLTRDGCAYAQSINLRLDQKNEVCSLIARYHPDAMDGGGMILLDDDKTISVTSSMLLSHTKSNIELPATESQKSSVMWFRVWLWATILFSLIVGIYILVARKNK